MARWLARTEFIQYEIMRKRRDENDEKDERALIIHFGLEKGVLISLKWKSLREAFFSRFNFEQEQYYKL